MTIIWFTENYPPNKGGMARSCDRIISSLRQHHTIHIYHFTNKEKPFIRTANIGGTYTAVPVFEDSSHSLNMLWAYINQQSQILESSVLVSYGSHLALKGLSLISKWLEKPLLTCIRGNDFDNAIFSQKKQDLLYALEHSAAIGCVSKEKVKRIKSMCVNAEVYFTPNSIHFSDWGVLKSDISLAEHLKQKLPSEKTIIGLIGYLKQKKGIDFFINTLQKSVLRNNVHLRIVGEIEPHIEAILIAKNISYSKALPESKTQLIANYLVCDVVAIPSIYDGMPNVLFEAAALNVPIIASKAGGIPDVLTNETAFLFNTLSEISLLETLLEYNVTTLELRIEKSKALQQHIKTNFSSTQETNNYLNIFKQIIKA
jgi:glycosyltransferase involved in cell wall biosynthesis